MKIQHLLLILACSSSMAFADGHILKICRLPGVVDTFTGKEIPFDDSQSFINEGDYADSVLKIPLGSKIAAKAKCTTVSAVVDTVYKREPKAGEIYLWQGQVVPSPNVIATVVK